jgi:hypothetical protein
MIDAHEGRAVQTFDVPGAYLQTPMPEDKIIHMKFEGDFVDILCKSDESFRQHVTYEGNKKVLYVRVHKAIYGLIESALLWYEVYTETLQGMGFKLNPYDRCLANKMIDGSQCTVGWFVDDNKISHKSNEVLTKLADEIESKFEGELVRSVGKKHTFLGIDFEILPDKKVAITTPQHIREVLEDFGEVLKGDVVNPAKSKLFTIIDEADDLPEERKELFHSCVAKLLWIEKRSRPDLETAVSFLCTRVQKPTEEDWGKLRRTLNFLKVTERDRRIIGCSGEDLSLHTWVDASHAIHENMRGHTGGCMSTGVGVIHGKASKQKMNTKSTTESEVVGVSEYIPYKIQMINILKGQGYALDKKVLYQDNESAIRLIKNGRNSCTGNSRHISIRYYFVKDRVDKGEFTVEYCNTLAMIADYFTKPLQGELFRRLRRVIMGWDPIEILNTFVIPTDKERIENDVSGDITNNGEQTYCDALLK